MKLYYVYIYIFFYIDILYNAAFLLCYNSIHDHNFLAVHSHTFTGLATS